MFTFRDQQPASTQQPTPVTPATKTHLLVPYAEKDEAKQLGAKWDKVARKWYAPNNEPALLERWGTTARALPHTLLHEDRTFGSPELCVDLLPKACWCKKLRYVIKRDDVDRVCACVFDRVQRTCEGCGCKEDTDNNPRTRLELHGRWAFDHDNGTQTLVRLMALCTKCYEVTHFGTASYHGRRQQAMAHWQHVTRRTPDECQLHIDQAYASVAEKNRIDWTVDMTLLTANGVQCLSEAEVARGWAKAREGGAGKGGGKGGSGGRRDARYAKKTTEAGENTSKSGFSGFAFRGS